MELYPRRSAIWDDHAKAALIYNHPDLFSDEEQAWAVWVLSAMAFASKLDGSFGYDRKGATAKKVDERAKRNTLLWKRRNTN